MKKIIALSSVVGYLFTPVSALASIDVTVTPPKQGVSPTTPLGDVISNALTIIFIFAALAVLFFLVIGAFQWITSGGDKEKVGNARKGIVAALVGLALLALAFLIVNIVAQILGFGSLTQFTIPTLGQTPIR